ncbi:hypothetical protein V5O48_001924 [Marasmius crinis-equi]|uniref:NADH dehydrogenase [ubiquinone] 1 alpha subcomplex subunit 13 n=1 Tax=Marasmius crinis-equi TaxID=585013 RepID=A0ABR3FWZ4_9AGAR
MPPPGGFEPIKYKRNLPFRGPGGWAILGGVAAVSAFGFYRYGQGALERRYVAIFPPTTLFPHRVSWSQNVFIHVPLLIKRGYVASVWIRPLLAYQSMTVTGLMGTGPQELQREKVWSRIHLVPLLMAEGDRDAYRRREAAVAREREIMKDVKGWEVRSQ